ncbi:ABC transporter substrate-binding protein, partial [Klebsiella pneumoniae]|nr:ABC transporter substrate-binding protein [Klebsiella pneumoniae]
MVDTSGNEAALTVASSSGATSLDFTTTSGAAAPSVLMDNVYETLVRIDEDGSITPGLAKDWDISEDAKTYTFHLRDDVTFSNGDP